MKILKKERKICMSCMEEHEVFLVEVLENNVFKGQSVEYNAIYEYCESTEEYFATTELLSRNDIAMKNAYRKSKGLLLGGYEHQRARFTLHIGRHVQK